jgi:hypothetical protein
MPNRLKILGELTKFGYKRFQSDFVFLDYSLKYKSATMADEENDPYIITFVNQKNEKFFMWSFIFNKLVIPKDWNDELEDSIQFNCENFYINADSFLIPEVDSLEDLYHFSDINTFTRPIIKSIDNRTEYGYKRFIVSDAGILFSIHQYLEHKLLDNGNQILIDKVKIINEKTVVVTIGESFDLEVCHLIPVEASFWN